MRWDGGGPRTEEKGVRQRGSRCAVGREIPRVRTLPEAEIQGREEVRKAGPPPPMAVLRFILFS